MPRLLEYEHRLLEVFGETFWRPYCHVTDIAEAVREAIEVDRLKVRGEAFNVGNTTENYRKKEIVELILKRLPDRRELVSYVRRDEDPRDYRVSFDKIRRTLGFEPKMAVSDGIDEIINALRDGRISNSLDRRFRNDDIATYEALSGAGQ